MIGMNAFFHLTAATLTLLLVYGWLRTLRQRNFVLELLGGIQSTRQGQMMRVYVDLPHRFLARFADAFRIPLEGSVSSVGSLRRISPRPLVDLFLQHGARGILLSQSPSSPAPVIIAEFTVDSVPGSDLKQEILTALGHGVIVEFRLNESKSV